MFRICCPTNERTVSQAHLGIMFSALGFDLESADIANCLEKIGISACDGPKYITSQEFIKIASIFISRRNPVEEMQKLFQLFDEDSSGTISLRNLKDLSREVGLKLNDTMLKDMIRTADKDNDGVLSILEFQSVLKANGSIASHDQSYDFMSDEG